MYTNNSFDDEGLPAVAALDVENLVGRRATARWERVSVGDLLERGLWRNPDQEAIVARPGAYSSAERARLTYRQANALACRIANALLARGLEPGDRVLFFCENSVEAYIAKLGVAKAGLVAAPLNPRMTPDVQEYLLAVLEPAIAFVDAELWPRAREALTGHDLTGVVIPIGGHEVPEGWVMFDDFVAGAADDEPDVAIHGDDIWEILPTSGTTSMPKSVMLSHHLATYNAFVHGMSHTRGLDAESDLRICSLLPAIYHATDHSHTFPAFLVGGSLVLGRTVSAAEHAAAVTELKVTALAAGSAQFLEELVAEVEAHPGRYDLTSLTSILWTWGALHPRTVDVLNSICDGVQLVEILGQTESLSCTRYLPNRDLELHRASAPRINHAGLPNGLLDAGLMEADGTVLGPDSPGRPGEIVYRSPVMTAGYYRDLPATQEAFRHGWFHSGDICAYDENGLLVMLDRAKDVIKSGGETVSSLRVEQVVSAYPGVARAAVVGLPHPRWTEAVTAVVVPLDPDLDLEQLAAHCRSHLAGFERPKRFVVVDELPFSVGSKVRKADLRSSLSDLFDDEPGVPTSAPDQEVHRT